MNLLTNPSFKDGWTDGLGGQYPNGWLFGFIDGEIPDNVDWDVYPALQPEIRVLPKSQVPQDEWPLFFLDGDYCVKVFGANKPVYFWFAQGVDLEQGARYRFTLPVHLDIYEWDDGKVYPGLDDGASNVQLRVAFSDGSDVRTDWMSPDGAAKPESDYVLNYGEYSYLTLEFTAETPRCIVGFVCAAKWPNLSNNFFFDALTLERVDGGDPPPPEPGDCENPAREPYDRHVILFSPTTTYETAMAIFAAEFDKKRSFMFSGDDAGIGCGLESRTVGAVDPDGWPSDLHDFFNQYYPGIQYYVYGSEPEPPPPPPPPPPTQKLTNGYIGPHIQAMVPGLLEYIARVKPPVTKIFGAGDVFPIKAASPNTHVIFRKYLHNSEQQDLLDMPDKHAAAQLYIDSFLDVFNYVVPELQALYPDQDPVLCIESLNEVYECDHSKNFNSAEFDIALMEAVADMGLPVRVVAFCAAQGNFQLYGPDLEVLLMLGEAAQQYGAWLGYHDYWGANIAYPPNYLVDAGWPWSPGRWQLFDDYLVQNGVYVTWVGGESGACTSENGYNLSSGGGWRADECHGSSITRYVTEIMHVDEKDAAWDAANGGRRIGRVLFTDGLTGEWDLFECGAALWNAVGDAMVERYG